MRLRAIVLKPCCFAGLHPLYSGGVLDNLLRGIQAFHGDVAGWQFVDGRIRITMTPR